MTKTVIIGGKRTPFGKLQGDLSSLVASDLGAIAIKGALESAKINPSEIEYCVLGTVLQAEQGQLPSRQASVKAGLPWSTETETINKVCASGLRSVTLANQLIRLGTYETAVAGGMESMSNAPYAISGARSGLRMGDKSLRDLMIYDGLTCSFTGVHMGVYGDQVAKDLEITRIQQDEWAYLSHQRVIQAMEEGKLKAEITPVTIKIKKEQIEVNQDEAPRKDTTVEKLSSLRSAFTKDGTITAGNAPGVNDGAAALVLTSEDYALKNNLSIEAYIIDHAQIAVEAKDFPKTPGLVINKLLEQTNKTVEDIDLFEINEAFAMATLASMKLANIPADKVNVNGGAVALGHPIGASGSRIILTLLEELKRRGGGVGIAAICSGGGQGDAIMIEVLKQ